MKVTIFDTKTLFVGDKYKKTFHRLTHHLPCWQWNQVLVENCVFVHLAIELSSGWLHFNNFLIGHSGENTSIWQNFMYVYLSKKNFCFQIPVPQKVKIVWMGVVCKDISNIVKDWTINHFLNVLKVNVLEKKKLLIYFKMRAVNIFTHFIWKIRNYTFDYCFHIRGKEDKWLF